MRTHSAAFVHDASSDNGSSPQRFSIQSWFDTFQAVDMEGHQDFLSLLSRDIRDPAFLRGQFLSSLHPANCGVRNKAGRSFF